MVVLKTKLLLHTIRKLASIWNGAMFGDLDWPLRASHGFVSISWGFGLPARCVE